MPARRHVALDGFGLRGVDDGVEEVGFAVLAAEVLEWRWRWLVSTKRPNAVVERRGRGWVVLVKGSERKEVRESGIEGWGKDIHD